ncbi:plasmid segregation protein ParM [Thermodesulfitimonas autotrophica]|uniref:Plasmid segregation protein ParM n=1 Tax=Thermodesulfitimonas autotrophica TaxID=1894989 RepID=A0A3N5ABW4_9THEO|nr:ParM/StbA family protein [Thermodesulfitimonas autotrophica]RPF41993.1 plasmid segregation protein ParM [Thermodesulfitimonas autotrophica]
MSVSVLEKPALATQTSPARRAVAADIGYGYTKAVSTSGKRACFPSVVAPAVEDPLAGALSNGPGHRVRVRYLNGEAEEKLVGEAALRSLAAVATLSRQKPEGMHDLLVLTAAYLVGVGGAGAFPGQADLAVGLPLAYYRSQKNALAARLKTLAAWVLVDGGEERYISFNRVLVLPQGAGAVAACPELLPGEGLVGVVDVGQYTTDYLLLEVQDGRPVPVLDCCGGAEVGVHLVHRAVAAEFQAQTGAPLPVEMREGAVKARRITFNGRTVDLFAAVERALSDAAQAVSQRVIGAWGNRAGFVKTVILCGGGVLLLKERLEACLPGVVVPEEPVYANAVGFLKALAGS